MLTPKSRSSLQIAKMCEAIQTIAVCLFKKKKKKQ